MRIGLIACAALLAVCVLSSPAAADKVFTWSGQAIVGGDDSYYLPEGTATFSISGGVLTLVLENTNNTQNIEANWQVLSGFVWSITDPGVILTPLDAIITSGSILVDNTKTDVTPIHGDDLSTEWAYKTGVTGGPLLAGDQAIGSVGSIAWENDGFSPSDRFDTSGNLFPPPSGSLNGAEGSIIGALAEFYPNAGFKEPVVSNSMTFRWTITGTLTDGEIVFGEPIFGTEGAPLPEPATMILLVLGAAAIALRIRRKRT